MLVPIDNCHSLSITTRSSIDHSRVTWRCSTTWEPPWASCASASTPSCSPLWPGSACWPDTRSSSTRSASPPLWSRPWSPFAVSFFSWISKLNPTCFSCRGSRCASSRYEWVTWHSRIVGLSAILQLIHSTSTFPVWLHWAAPCLQWGTGHNMCPLQKNHWYFHPRHSSIMVFIVKLSVLLFTSKLHGETWDSFQCRA